MKSVIEEQKAPPEDDIEVSAAHRRRVAPVLARRALRDAVEDARQRESA